MAATGNDNDFSNERDFSQRRYDLDARNDPDMAIERIRTAGSISISPELFEKIYLSPLNQVKGDMRKTFGNPTPIALGGFLLALSPLTNDLLGWRGSGGLGAAEIGNYFFFGGLLMIIGGVFELILGNTFPAVVFSMFGAFWLSYAATLQPFYHAASSYEPSQPAMAYANPEFAASFAFFMIYMGVLCFIFLVCSIRTNLVFFLIFACLVCAFSCLAASFWYASTGKASKALTLQHAGAGLAYAVCCLGWYLFAVQLLDAVDFPFNLPVIDLSQVVKGGRDRQRSKAVIEHKHDEEAPHTNGNSSVRRTRDMIRFWKKA